MARKKGLTDFNLSLIRCLMREQSKGTTELSKEIDVTQQHLSRVLNRQSPLSEDIGKRLSVTLGVSWEVVKQPESSYMRELMSMALVEFLQVPGELDWKNAVRLADKMGYLSGGVADSGEISAAQIEDEDLLEIGDTPEAFQTEIMRKSTQYT